MIPFGHCGGRPLRSKQEADVCLVLNDLGLAHAHSPRHFEVTLEEGKAAAFSPDIVVRGRGREGKAVVFQTIVSLRDSNLKKVEAFRRQYGHEFFVILVTPEELIYKVSKESYDEITSTETLRSLLSRMVD